LQPGDLARQLCEAFLRSDNPTSKELDEVEDAINDVQCVERTTAMLESEEFRAEFSLRTAPEEPRG